MEEIKLVEFTLSQLFLDLKQLADISNKALPKIYSKYEYNRNMKSEILGRLTPLKTTVGFKYDVIHLLKN